MRLDALGVRLRARTPVQAADLGIRLCQASARPVYLAYAVVALPVMTLALVSSELASWLPMALIWCAAPWFDRTILFVLSGAAFGQPPTPLDVWRAQRQVWWRHLWFTWTVRRLSPWRTVTDPVYLLEELPLGRSGRRARQIRGRQVGTGLMLTQTFAFAELALLLALMSLVIWLAPQGLVPEALAFLNDRDAAPFVLTVSIAYAATVFFLEPFYVAAGFGMYLNRRAELEAWDIEQEFRRAFTK